MGNKPLGNSVGNILGVISTSNTQSIRILSDVVVYKTSRSYKVLSARQLFPYTSPRSNSVTHQNKGLSNHRYLGLVFTQFANQSLVHLGADCHHDIV